MKTLPERTGEQEVVAGLVSFLQKQGYRVRTEVPNMGQSADIGATRGRWLTFVEAKCYDWRRALIQCRAHELVADYICIAVALQSFSDDLLKIVLDLGYGLIKYDVKKRECDWVVRPRLNEKVWPPQRKRLTAAMSEIDYEH